MTAPAGLGATRMADAATSAKIEVKNGLFVVTAGLYITATMLTSEPRVSFS